MHKNTVSHCHHTKDIRGPGCKSNGSSSCLRKRHRQHTLRSGGATEPAAHPSGSRGAQAVRLARRSRSYENRPGLTAVRAFSMKSLHARQAFNSIQTLSIPNPSLLRRTVSQYRSTAVADVPAVGNLMAASTAAEVCSFLDSDGDGVHTRF